MPPHIKPSSSEVYSLLKLLQYHDQIQNTFSIEDFSFLPQERTPTSSPSHILLTQQWAPKRAYLPPIRARRTVNLRRKITRARSGAKTTRFHLYSSTGRGRCCRNQSPNGSDSSSGEGTQSQEQMINRPDSNTKQGFRPSARRRRKFA